MFCLSRYPGILVSCRLAALPGFLLTTPHVEYYPRVPSYLSPVHIYMFLPRLGSPRIHTYHTYLVARSLVPLVSSILRRSFPKTIRTAVLGETPSRLALFLPSFLPSTSFNIPLLHIRYFTVSQFGPLLILLPWLNRYCLTIKSTTTTGFSQPSTTVPALVLFYYPTHHGQNNVGHWLA